MTQIVARCEKRIHRPIQVVQAQFIDMVHHASAHVHRALEVSNVRARQGGCRFTGRRRVFGRLQEDEIEVTRLADGNSTLTGISGPNVGLRVTQEFEAIDSGSTRVRISVQLPVRGLLALLAPLVRIGVQRDLAAALEEDRVDLEDHGYPKHE